MRTRIGLVPLLPAVLTLIGMAPTVGAAPPRPQGPCDIYGAAGTPCVAAHSTTRALYASYNGPLYQVKRPSPGPNFPGPGKGANAAITAVICANDLMALGTLHELRDRGLRVPHDISVTGFDNIKLGKFSDPPLMSVHISREKIGRIICDCLFGPATLLEREFVIDPELVLRDPTGPAPRVVALG